MTDNMRKRIEYVISTTMIHNDERITNGAIIAECNAHKDELDEFEYRLVKVINEYRRIHTNHASEIFDLQTKLKKTEEEAKLLLREEIRNIGCGKCFDLGRRCMRCEEEDKIKAIRGVCWLLSFVMAYFILSKILYWTWWFLLLSKAGTGSSELLQLLKDYIGTL